MKICTILCFVYSILIFPTILFGQDPPSRDSLWQVFLDAPKDSTKGNFALQISRSFGTDQVDSALHYGLLALQEFKDRQYLLGQVKAHKPAQIPLQDRPPMEPAVVQHRALIKLYQQLKNPVRKEKPGLIFRGSSRS